jgi:hypothetical protein
MPAQQRPVYPAGKDSFWAPIRDTNSARIGPAQNVQFWPSIGHYSCTGRDWRWHNVNSGGQPHRAGPAHGSLGGHQG